MNGALRHQRYGPCSTERLREPGEHDEVGVKLDALQASDAERGEAVVVLQASELALDGGAAAVEVAITLSVVCRWTAIANETANERTTRGRYASSRRSTVSQRNACKLEKRRYAMTQTVRQESDAAL